MERVNSLSSSWNIASTSPVGKRSGGFFNSQRQIRAKPCCGPVLQAPNWAVGSSSRRKERKKQRKRIKVKVSLNFRIYDQCRLMTRNPWPFPHASFTQNFNFSQLTKNNRNSSSNGPLSIKYCLLAENKKNSLEHH